MPVMIALFTCCFDGGGGSVHLKTAHTEATKPEKITVNDPFYRVVMGDPERPQITFPMEEPGLTSKPA